MRRQVLVRAVAQGRRGHVLRAAVRRLVEQVIWVADEGMPGVLGEWRQPGY
jgi:hypothetical protein